ncbi:MAG TPA: SCO2322 family protein [Lapillicoccus sp.]|nr:SCO2322 family protein [Lapillicoccus sp.]
MTRPVHGARGASIITLIGTVLALVIGLLTAAPASAASYQYWGYYQLTDGAWTFSQKGAAETNPTDGSVEGWRWAITEESGTPPRNPRVTPTFDEVCGSAAAESGKKRVGVVLDYGRDVDGDGTRPPDPVAECAVVPTAATGAEVLAAVATVRTGDAGLVCGIDNYPASGCGGPVATLSEAQKAADTPATLAPVATPQSTPSSATPGAGAASASETAGPLIAPAPASSTTSGVPVVVWVGLLILVLGVAALVASALRRRRQNV